MLWRDLHVPNSAEIDSDLTFSSWTTFVAFVLALMFLMAFVVLPMFLWRAHKAGRLNQPEFRGLWGLFFESFYDEGDRPLFLFCESILLLRKARLCSDL